MCVRPHFCLSEESWKRLQTPPDTSCEIPSVFYLEEPADLWAASWRSSSRTGSEYVLRRMQVWGGDECYHESDRGREKWAHTTEISHEEEWPVLSTQVTTFTVTQFRSSWCLPSLGSVVKNSCSNLKKTAGEKGVTANSIRKHVDRFACFLLPLTLRMFSLTDLLVFWKHRLINTHYLLCVCVGSSKI